MSQFKAPPVPGVGVGIGADNNWKPEINPESINNTSSTSPSSSHDNPTTSSTSNQVFSGENQVDSGIISNSSTLESNSNQNNNKDDSNQNQLGSSIDRPLETTPSTSTSGTQPTSDATHDLAHDSHAQATTNNMNSGVDATTAKVGVNDSAAGDTNVGATSNSTPTTTPTVPTSNQQTSYPEQKHAGKVGYGPNYKPPNTGPSITNKLTGNLEILKGKLLHRSDIVEHGYLKKTGALEELNKEEDEVEDPFKKGINTEGTEAQKIAKGEDPVKLQSDSQKSKVAASGI